MPPRPRSAEYRGVTELKSARKVPDDVADTLWRTVCQQTLKVAWPRHVDERYIWFTPQVPTVFYMRDDIAVGAADLDAAARASFAEVEVIADDDWRGAADVVSHDPQEPAAKRPRLADDAGRRFGGERDPFMWSACRFGGEREPAAAAADEGEPRESRARDAGLETHAVASDFRALRRHDKGVRRDRVLFEAVFRPWHESHFCTEPTCECNFCTEPSCEGNFCRAELGGPFLHRPFLHRAEL